MMDDISDLSTETRAAAAANAAACFQLAEKPSVVWHPSDTLFADTLDAILPAVRTFAIAKNVPLEERDVEPVAMTARCTNRFLFNIFVMCRGVQAFNF